MITGKLKEPLVLDVGKEQDVYICRGVWIEVRPCAVQPNALSKSSVLEVMQKIKLDRECNGLLEGEVRED